MDESPYDVWNDWSANQRDLFVIDYEGNLVLHQNISGGLPNDLQSIIIDLIAQIPGDEECIDGEISYDDPCNLMQCVDGVWLPYMVIDCEEQMGIPCEGGEYIPPVDGECCSTCVEYSIEGRWHPVGFENNTMYQFENDYRYTIHTSDGTFGGIEDAIPNPSPYTVDGNTIIIDLYFGNIATYEMDFRCDGQVVDFYYDDDWEGLHSSLYREGFDYNYCVNMPNDVIEGRWHLVGYEDNVMYQFVDTEPFADAGYKYTIYSTDGNFDDLEGGNTGGTPNPYSIVENIITIDYHFGNIVSYQMNYQCNGQVVEFYNSDYNVVSFTLFREYYDYNECEEVEYWTGDINNDSDINILDVVLLVSFILMTDEPTDVEFYAGDINSDNLLNVLDVVAIVQLILNPNESPEDCYIEPEIGPCDGICPTYYFNQNTNQCEEFITGCCGVEAFNTLQECQNTCE